MLFVGDREAVGAFEALPAPDLGVVEGLAWLCEEMRRPRLGLLGGDASPLEPRRLVTLELLEDRRAPDWAIEALDREREEEVSLQARPEDAASEKRRGHRRTSADLPAASSHRDGVPSFTQGGQDSLDVLFVVDIDGAVVERPVLLGPTLLSVGEDVSEQHAPVSAGPLRRCDRS